MAAGKAWERQVFAMVNEKIPIVEQVTVKAKIKGEMVESVLDALGRDVNGWVVLESKLNPGTKLRPGQALIREHLASGGEVTIAATDKDKIAELREKLKVGPKTSVSTSRYKIVNQGNVSTALSDLKVIPEGHGTILHPSGELTVHPPEEMKRIQAVMEKHPGLDMKAILQKARETGSDTGKAIAKETRLAGSGAEAAVKVSKEASEGLLKRGGRFLGKKALGAIPLVGAGYTLFAPGEASATERVVRAVAGEIGVGPLDLETLYDALNFVFINTEPGKPDPSPWLCAKTGTRCY
jgi:hypothetical protein